MPGRVHGGSDPDIDGPLIVMTLVRGIALCAECLARKTGVPGDEVTAVLARVRKHIVLHEQSGRCHRCLMMKTVYTLNTALRDGRARDGGPS